MAEMLNNLRVNVTDSEYNAYLQFYDNNYSLINTRGEGIYFNEDMSYTFANARNMYMNMDDTWYGYYAKVVNMSHTYYNCQNIRGSVTVR